MRRRVSERIDLFLTAVVDFQPVLDLADLPANGFKAVEIDGRSILVGRINNELFACLDRCPHAGAPLRIAKLRGEELMCAWHGWVFNVLSGHAVPDNPAFQLTKLPIKLEGSKIFVAVPPDFHAPSAPNNVL